MWRKKEKNPNEPRVDRMVLAVRQRRVLSAVEQVATLPEFFGLRIKPRTLLDSDRLDARRQSLGAAEAVRRQWSGPAALATALQTMAGLIPDEGVNLHLDEADEARWMHAKSMPAMVKAVATALPTLQRGFAIFGDDEPLRVGFDEFCLDAGRRRAPEAQPVPVVVVRVADEDLLVPDEERRLAMARPLRRLRQREADRPQPLERVFGRHAVVPSRSSSGTRMFQASVTSSLRRRLVTFSSRSMTSGHPS
jgi:hypothetical protein